MSAYVPADLRRRVREHFSSCCAYCHTAERLTVATFEVEHILPRSSGGETVFENLCLACPTCNRFKATRTKAIDPDTQEAIEVTTYKADGRIGSFDILLMLALAPGSKFSSRH